MCPEFTIGRWRPARSAIWLGETLGACRAVALRRRVERLAFSALMSSRAQHAQGRQLAAG